MRVSLNAGLGGAENFASAVIRSQVFPDHSGSLYRLRYPGRTFREEFTIFSLFF
jgi:hypothetical protein